MFVYSGDHQREREVVLSIASWIILWSMGTKRIIYPLPLIHHYTEATHWVVSFSELLKVTVSILRYLAWKQQPSTTSEASVRATECRFVQVSQKSESVLRVCHCISPSASTKQYLDRRQAACCMQLIGRLW